jgi:hypothetical protein
MIRGSAQQHPERLRNDSPKIESTPELPPRITFLNEAEREIWDWLIKTTYKRGLHGTSDGVAFLRCARMIVRMQELDEKVHTCGLTAKNPRTLKLESSAYARLSRDVWTHLGLAMAEIGGTPIGRARIASTTSDPVQGGLWDEID